MKRKYWLYLEPFVHTRLKKDQNNDSLLIYNTLNRAHILRSGNDSVTRLVKPLADKKNLSVIPLTEEDLADKSVRDFIAEVRTKFIGDIIDQSLVNGKPIQIPLEAKIMKKPEKKLCGGFEYKHNHQKTNLYGLTIYLNQMTGNQVLSDYPGDAFRQFVSPCFKGSGKKIKGSGKKEETNIPLPALMNFIREAENNLLNNVYISGGNIFDYPQLAELSAQLDQFSFTKNYYVHYSQLNADNADFIPQPFSESGNLLNIMVDFPVNKENLENSMARLKDASMKIQYKFHLIVTRMEEVEQADQLIARYGLSNTVFQPYFTGENLDFFQEAVFIHQEDILNQPSGMRKLQVREKVNPLHYGQLTVLNNGDIHANINEPKIGELGVDSIYSILDNALETSKSWWQTRNSVEPCNQCVFQVLCPPISNYEYQLGRFNLCHVK
jgi:pseudo-rSAM protein